jgi:hypothetical protein
MRLRRRSTANGDEFDVGPAALKLGGVLLPVSGFLEREFHASFPVPRLATCYLVEGGLWLCAPLSRVVCLLQPVPFIIAERLLKIMRSNLFP